MTNNSLKAGTKVLPTNALRWDPAAGSSYSAGQIRKLVAIERTAILAPIVVDEAMQIVSGQGLWLAARHLRLSEAPVALMGRRRFRRDQR